jgi:hypothetical protein
VDQPSSPPAREPSQEREYRRGVENERGQTLWQRLWHFNDKCEGYPTRNFVVRQDRPSERPLQPMPTGFALGSLPLCGTKIGPLSDAIFCETARNPKRLGAFETMARPCLSLAGVGDTPIEVTANWLRKANHLLIAGFNGAHGR